MDSLTSLRVFRMVAEFKSFTAASRRLDLSPAMASKHVMHLERQLGTRLLNRTSRHVSLTEAGQIYFDQVRPILEGLEEAEAAVSNVTVVPRGTLRFSAPVWFANPVFARMLADYHQRYPDVCFDIDLSGRMVNLVDEGFDLALRTTASDNLDPGLIARPLAEVGFQLLASPEYLRRAGRPANVVDLNGHALLLYSGIRVSDGALKLGAEPVRFKIVLETGNETMLHLGALEGLGMTFLPKWMIEDDIVEGRLERVLPGFEPLVGRLFAVYPSRKYLSAKVRTFIDFFAQDGRLS